MTMAKQPDLRREMFWRQLFQQWHRSGLTVRAFCAKHGLAEPSFYAWRRILSERDQQRATPVACPSRATNTQPAFVPVHVMTTPASAVLELVVDQNLVLRVPVGFDAATLRHLLAILKETAAC
jgi:transposase-like protein